MSPLIFAAVVSSDAWCRRAPAMGGPRALGPASRRVPGAVVALAAILSSCAAHTPFVPTIPVAPEAVVRRTLGNGLQVVVVRNSLAPVVTTMINYRVGSVETPEGFPGTAHADEHMMFRGSPGLSADQLASITAAMGGRFNANTQQTVTQYYFTVPADEFELPLRIEATRMRGILATEGLWEKERGAIEQEVAQDLSNPEFVAYEKILDAVFRRTPYAHDPLGTRSSFDRTTAAMLRRFHDTWYAPNNAILVIAGDVDPDSALGAVERLFAIGSRSSGHSTRSARRSGRRRTSPCASSTTTSRVPSPSWRIT